MIQNIIEKLEKEREKWFLAKESKDFLVSFIERNKLKTVLEVGTAQGYSALYFSLVADKVVTIEKSKPAFALAEENLKDLENVEMIFSDAKKALEDLIARKEIFDFIFIDGETHAYVDLIKLALGLVDEKGFIVADNTISHEEKLEDFFYFLKGENIPSETLILGDGLTFICQRGKNEEGEMRLKSALVKND